MDIDPQQDRYRFELLDPLEDIYLCAEERDAARVALQISDWTAGLMVHATRSLQTIFAVQVPAGAHWCVPKFFRRLSAVHARPS